jgi:hypothetical protein
MLTTRELNRSTLARQLLPGQEALDVAGWSPCRRNMRLRRTCPMESDRRIRPGRR